MLYTPVAFPQPNTTSSFHFGEGTNNTLMQGPNSGRVSEEAPSPPCRQGGDTCQEAARAARGRLSPAETCMVLAAGQGVSRALGKPVRMSELRQFPPHLLPGRLENFLEYGNRSFPGPFKRRRALQWTD